MRRVTLVVAVLGCLWGGSASADDQRQVSGAARDESAGLGAIVEEYQAVTATLERRQILIAVTASELHRFRSSAARGAQEHTRTIEALETILAAACEDIAPLKRRRATL